MSNHANRDQPIRDLSTWTLDRLEAFTITQQGHELERVREVAQSLAYRSDEPRHVRLRWAKLSLNANSSGLVRFLSEWWGRSVVSLGPGLSGLLRAACLQPLTPAADPNVAGVTNSQVGYVQTISPCR